MTAQIEEQFKDALGGLDSFASAIGNNIPTFDDVPYNPEDAVGKSKRTIEDTSAIEGMLSRFDKFDFSSLNSPKIEEPTSTSTSADDLSPEEEAEFAKFDMSALEAAAAALKSIDPSEEDLEGNKKCNSIE